MEVWELLVLSLYDDHHGKVARLPGVNAVEMCERSFVGYDDIDREFYTEGTGDA